MLRPVRKKKSGEASYELSSHSTMNMLAASRYSILCENYKPVISKDDDNSNIWWCADNGDLLAPSDARQECYSAHEGSHTREQPTILTSKPQQEMESGLIDPEPSTSNRSFSKYTKRKFDPAMQWHVGVLTFGGFAWGWATSLFYVLLPEYAKTCGLSSQQISNLLMVSGVVGFVCRSSCIILGE